METTIDPEICLIWAQDRNGVIGIDQDMAWQVPGDTQFFRKTTSGHPVIMGRKTWEALNSQPLPKRHNIVVSRQLAQLAPEAEIADRVSFVADPQAAIAAAQPFLSATENEVWVMGGGMIYREFMPLATRLVVTSIDLQVDCEKAAPAEIITAPAIDTSLWEVDAQASDSDWRPLSGDARWRVTTWVRKAA